MADDRGQDVVEIVRDAAGELADRLHLGLLLRLALEGLLFITDRPLSAAELGKLINVRDQDKIVAAVEDLRRELEESGRGYRLLAVAEGWQMATRPELAPYMRKLFSDRATMRLSTAAQETLSIISYKQPLTRAEIEEIRGVVEWGAGPRAGQAIVLAAKARALLAGRYAVTLADLGAVVPPALRHRVVLSFRGQAEGMTTDALVQKLLERIEPPRSPLARNPFGG